MKTYRFSVELVVDVQAYDQFDAEEMVRDSVGIGEIAGIEVVECEVGDGTIVNN